MAKSSKPEEAPWGSGDLLVLVSTLALRIQKSVDPNSHSTIHISIIVMDRAVTDISSYKVSSHFADSHRAILENPPILENRYLGPGCAGRSTILLGLAKDTDNNPDLFGHHHSSRKQSNKGTVTET